MPDHHLLNGLFSHGGREKYPSAAGSWRSRISYIHTYIHTYIKEYKTRIRRIWSSELNAANKIIAHNTLVTPVISYTIGILHWNKKEIKDLDISTRKLLTMKGSFHRASDISRLYTDRKKGGRGLQCMEDLYESRTIKLKEHLEQAAPSHSLLEMVKAD